MIGKIYRIIIVFIMAFFMHVGYTKAFVDKIEKNGSTSIKGSTFGYGKDSPYFTIQKVNYDGSKKVAFCGHWVNAGAINNRTFCLDTWKSKNISAGVGAILKEYGECVKKNKNNDENKKKCYYDASIAIHVFLTEYGKDSKPSHIDKVAYTDYYDVAKDAYENHNKILDFDLSKSSITYAGKDNGKDKYEFQIYVNPKKPDNTYQSFSESTEVQLKELNNIVGNDSKCSTSDKGYTFDCYVKLIDSSKNGSCKIAVTGKSNEYYYAAKYYPNKTNDCKKISHTAEQPLIPFHYEPKQITTTKDIKLNFEGMNPVTIIVNGYDCTTGKKYALEGAIVEVTGTGGGTEATVNGKVEFSNLPKGESRTITITKDSYKSITKNIETKKKSYTYTLEMNKDCSAKTTCTQELPNTQNYKELYNRIQNNEVINDCVEGDCKGLLDETNASCGPSKDCATQLSDILDDYNNNKNYQQYMVALQNLYSQFSNNSKLLDYNEPDCRPDDWKVKSDCSETIITEPKKISDNFVIKTKNGTYKKLICSTQYKFSHDLFALNESYNNGSLLWSAGDTKNKIIDANIVFDCEDILYDNPNISITEGDVKNNYRIDVTLNNTKFNIKNNYGTTTTTGFLEHYINTNLVRFNLNYVYQDGENYDSKKDKEIKLISLLEKISNRTEHVGESNDHYRISYYSDIVYGDKNLYRAKIGTGQLVSGGNNNTEEILGYGIPLPLNIKPGTYDKSSFTIKIYDSNNLSDVNDLTEPRYTFNSNDGGVNCPYTVDKISFKEHLISTDNPFGVRETVGNNWCDMNKDNLNNNTEINDNEDVKYDIRCSKDPNINKKINAYIKNSSNSHTNDSSKIKYSFTLTPDNIQKIRDYNKANKISSFESITCSDNGKNCVSSFLTSLRANKYAFSAGGDCLKTGQTDNDRLNCIKK